MILRRKILTFLTAGIISIMGVVGSAIAQSEGEVINSPHVTLETSMGKIVIALEQVLAPQTSSNFLMYANEGYYDNTIFHRVIDNFMIQGGGFTADMAQKKPLFSAIPLETHPQLKNDRGTVAMARTNAPNSATSQFFINVVDNKSLNASGPSNPGYAVFGRVVQGMDVVDKIRAVSTGTAQGHQNVPLSPIVINKVSVEMPQ